MARSKACLFASDYQLGSRLNLATAHPARMIMMGRLVRGGGISYLELIAEIPLAESSIADHLRIMTREGFLLDAVLSDGRTGYMLNHSLYQACTEARRRILWGQTSVLCLHRTELGVTV